MRSAVAILGAGLAGTACAERLTRAGFEVTVFEKARGPGGRMATRRAQPNQGSEPAEVSHRTPPLAFDHGVPAWTATTPEFKRFLQEAEAQGIVARWAPRIRTGSAQDTPTTQWVASPDMPALSRWLLQGVAVRTQCRIESLERSTTGWRLRDESGNVHGPFDAAVLAMPAAQAAALWAPHEPAWTQSAQTRFMSPCWTLMAAIGHVRSTSYPDPSEWDLWRPPASPTEESTVAGPLALVVRQDAKPGRTPQAGRQVWVAHTQPAWAQAHLEADAMTLLPRLQEALLEAIGQPDARWFHAVLHRWRFAQCTDPSMGERPYRWNPKTGLGGCGDWLCSGGVEGAWRSGRSLADAITTGWPQ